jgi:NADH dehydrogenase
MKNIVIIGAGFAGLWSAISAARARHLFNQESQIKITLINKTPYHDIRVCNYLEDIESTRLALSDILAPIDIELVIGEAIHIDTSHKFVVVNTDTHEDTIAYNKLILASGSLLAQPTTIPGLKEFGFNIDSYGAAKHLNQHLKELDYTHKQNIVIVGSGFTGLEIATELVGRLPKTAHLILIDKSNIASSLGETPNREILATLASLNIECLKNETIDSLYEDSVQLASGRNIPTQAVIWTTGLHASPLTQLFKTQKTATGRLPVNDLLQIAHHKDCFAAGDAALAPTDKKHFSMMSCQHAIPQGKIAGFNAVATLSQQPLITYQQAVYVTCLDLGPAGAMLMRGWERDIEKTGKQGKAMKQFINAKIRPQPSSNPEGLHIQANPSPKKGL